MMQRLIKYRKTRWRRVSGYFPGRCIPTKSFTSHYQLSPFHWTRLASANDSIFK
jgi:hypothetical protein